MDPGECNCKYLRTDMFLREALSLRSTSYKHAQTVMDFRFGSDAGRTNLCCRILSAYATSIPYRPMNSGAFGDRMGVMLDAFLEWNDAESVHFRKCCSLIAKDWNMPGATAEDRHLVFEQLADAHVFNQRGTYPKLGNWFAWNRAVAEKIPFFWCLVMVFEWSERDATGEEDV